VIKVIKVLKAGVPDAELFPFEGEDFLLACRVSAHRCCQELIGRRGGKPVVACR
jgi:hypothetical protein